MLEVLQDDTYRESVKQRLERNSLVDIKHGHCWEWQRAKTHGYGVINIKNKTYGAHRVSYMIFKGEIPKGLELDHLCRNPACINPEHLEPVTRKENVRRGVTSERQREIRLQTTHCNNGHLLDEHNLYIKPSSGQRVCRICRLERDQKYNRRVRERKGLDAPMSPREAARRASQASAEKARSVTHCQRGHEFNESNAYIRPGGTRMCRVCARLKRKGLV